MLPENLERIADQGGWDEGTKELYKEFSKMKPEQWKGINETLKVLKGFIDVEADVFRNFKDEITNSITLKIKEQLSPIKNELNDQLNKIIEPLIPFIEDVVNSIIVPVIQWIGDRIQDVMDFFSTEKPLPLWFWNNRYAIAGLTFQEIRDLYSASQPTDTSGYGR